jgi:hypothetical protein
MRLGLSSAAAPGATLDELLGACGRLGLSALELTAGHAHGIDPGDDGPERADRAAGARDRAAAVGVAIAAFRLDGSPAGGLTDFALALGASILVPYASAPALAVRVPDGVEVMAVLPGDSDPLASLDRLDAGHFDAPLLPVAWDADPASGFVTTAAAALLDRAGPRLRHIGLLGGGPEVGAQEGRGVGALMARIALSGFTGTVALAPSSERYRVAWGAWLGRRRGWGCGSRAEDRDLVTLGTP